MDADEWNKQYRIKNSPKPRELADSGLISIIMHEAHRQIYL